MYSTARADWTKTCFNFSRNFIHFGVPVINSFKKDTNLNVQKLVHEVQIRQPRQFVMKSLDDWNFGDWGVTLH